MSERYVRWLIQHQLLPCLVRLKKQNVGDAGLWEWTLSVSKTLVGRVIAFHGSVPMAASKVKTAPFNVWTGPSVIHADTDDPWVSKRSPVTARYFWWPRALTGFGRLLSQPLGLGCSPGMTRHDSEFLTLWHWDPSISEWEGSGWKIRFNPVSFEIP